MNDKNVLKPIRVAKSNPDKPYKTTKNVQVWNPIKGKEETIPKLVIDVGLQYKKIPCYSLPMERENV